MLKTNKLFFVLMIILVLAFNVSAASNVPSALQGNLLFEYQFTNASDATGTYDLSTTGSVTYPSGASCIKDSCADAPPNAYFTHITHLDTDNYNSGFTTVGWIKTSYIADNQLYWGWDETGSNGRIIVLSLSSENAKFGFKAFIRDSGLDVINDTWVHLAMTHNTTTDAIYVDGKLIATYGSATWTNGEDDFAVGVHPNMVGTWAGANASFDEIYGFNKSLSAAEILTIYNSNLGIAGAPTVTYLNSSYNPLNPLEGENVNFSIVVSSTNAIDRYKFQFWNVTSSLWVNVTHLNSSNDSIDYFIPISINETIDVDRTEFYFNGSDYIAEGISDNDIALDGTVALNGQTYASKGWTVSGSGGAGYVDTGEIYKGNVTILLDSGSVFKIATAVTNSTYNAIAYSVFYDDLDTDLIGHFLQVLDFSSNPIYMQMRGSESTTEYVYREATNAICDENTITRTLGWHTAYLDFNNSASAVYGYIDGVLCHIWTGKTGISSFASAVDSGGVMRVDSLFMTNDKNIPTGNTTTTGYFLNITQQTPIGYDYYNWTWHARDSNTTIYHQSEYYSLDAINDITEPGFLNQSATPQYPFNGDNVTFKITFTDDNQLSYSIFSWYNYSSNSWLNDTQINISGTINTSSVYKIMEANTYFNYTWYAIDTANKTNQSQLFYLNITVDTTAPIFTNEVPTPSPGFYNQDASFNITITDDYGLSNYTFSYIGDTSENDFLFYEDCEGTNGSSVDTNPLIGNYKEIVGMVYSNTTAISGSTSCHGTTSGDRLNPWVNISNIDEDNQVLSCSVYAYQPQNDGWFISMSSGSHFWGGLESVGSGGFQYYIGSYTSVIAQTTGEWWNMSFTYNNTGGTQLCSYYASQNDGGGSGEVVDVACASGQVNNNFTAFSTYTGGEVYFDDARCWIGGIDDEPTIISPTGWINETYQINGTSYNASINKTMPLNGTTYNYTWYAIDNFNNIGTSGFLYINLTNNLIVENVVAIPVTPYNLDELQCNFSIETIQPTNTVNITWYINGTQNSTYNYQYVNVNSSTLYTTGLGTGSFPGPHNTDDIYYCEVLGDDVADTVIVQSNNITILDSTPTPPIITQPLNHTYVSKYNTTINWTEGTSVYSYNVSLSIKNSSGSTTILLDNVNVLNYIWNTSAFGFGVYDIIMFATNEYSSGSNTTNINITINTLPEVNLAYILPSTAYNNDTLFGWSNITDINGQAIGYNYIWYRNGVNVKNGSVGTSLIYLRNVDNLSSSYLSVYDNITFSVLPYDGVDYGSWFNTSVTTITNRPLENLNIQLPLNNSIVNYDLNVTFNVTDLDEGLNCVLLTNETSTTNKNVSSNVNDYLFIDLTNDGVYSWNVSCTSDGDTTPLYSLNYNYEYDITPVQYTNYQQFNNSLFPQIDDTFLMNVTVSDAFHNVESCYLMINDTGVWENKTLFNVNNVTAKLEMSYVIQNYSVASQSQLAWNVWCNDTVSNSNIGTEQPFEILDVNLPLVIESGNVQNGSIISGALYNITFNNTFFDYNLFQAEINVSCDVSGTIYFNQVLDINTTTYTIADTIDLSGYPLQMCTFLSSASDDHTAKNIVDYDWTETETSLVFDTAEGNQITINSFRNADWTINKLSDRYTFEFAPFVTDAQNKYKFQIYCDNGFYYRPNSNYEGHFVCMNGRHGNWLDFQTADDTPVDVVDEGDGWWEIEVEFEGDSVVFESIGGTNVENSSFDFYIGAAINVSGLNIYDNTPFSNFTVDIITLTGYPQYNITLNVPTNYDWIENISNGTYTFDFSAQGRYFNQSYPVTIANVTQERAYETYEGIKRLYFTNIKSLTGIPNVSITITNVDTAKVDVVNTGNNVYYDYYANATNYTFDASQSDYYPLTGELFNISLLTNTSQTFYMWFLATFNLFDEKTLEEFNISSPDRISFLVICPDNTYETLVNVSFNFVVPIQCEYDKFRFILQYDTTGYYRSFLLTYEESINASIYLIDIANTNYVINTFIVEDLLNQYEDIEVYIHKNINSETVQITADQVDVENKITAFLMANNPYSIEVRSSNKPTKVIGSYSADFSGNKNLRLYDFTLNAQPVDYSTSVALDVGHMDNLTGTKLVLASYNDSGAVTTSVNWKVYADNQYGTLLSDVTSTQQNVIFSYVPPAAYQNYTLLTVYNITYLGANYITSSYVQVYDTDIDILNASMNNFITEVGYGDNAAGQTKINWIITIFLGFMALIFTVRTANVGAVVVALFGGALIFFKLYTLGWGVFIIALLMAIASLLKSKGDQQ